MDELRKLELRVLELAARIGAPREYIPTFGTTTNTGLPHIEYDAILYHFVEFERGSETSRKSTRDEGELINWILSHITFWMAVNYEVQHRKEGQDSRIILFNRHVELMDVIDSDYARKLADKYQKTLGFHFREQ